MPKKSYKIIPLSDKMKVHNLVRIDKKNCIVMLLFTSLAQGQNMGHLVRIKLTDNGLLA